MKIKKFDRKTVIKILILVIPIILIGLIFGRNIIVFLFVLATVILDFAIFIFPSIKYFGIELATFTTILIGFVYGPVAGAIAGFILLMLHLIIARYSFGIYIVWLIPAYVASGFLSGLMKGIGFMNIGIYMTIGIGLTNIFLSSLFDSSNFSENLIYSISNCAFNIFLFLQLSGLIAGIFI